MALQVTRGLVQRFGTVALTRAEQQDLLAAMMASPARFPGGTRCGRALCREYAPRGLPAHVRTAWPLPWFIPCRCPGVNDIAPHSRVRLSFGGYRALLVESRASVPSSNASMCVAMLVAHHRRGSSFLQCEESLQRVVQVGSSFTFVIGDVDEGQPRVRHMGLVERAMGRL